MPSELFRFGEFALDQRACELRRNGQGVRLERIPFELLNLLVERCGQLVTREEMIERAWGKGVFHDTEHGINTAVGKIRRALRDDPESPRFFVTVAGRGYRFIAPVQKVESFAAFASPPEIKEGHPPLATASSRKWHTIVFIPAAVFLVAIALAAFVHFHRVQPLSEKDTLVLGDIANHTGDAVFDETLKQALSVELSQSPFLKILSDEKISEAMRLMGRPVDERVNEKTALEICRRTQSTVALVGSIDTLGRQYVMGFNLLACRTGDLLAQEQLRANGKEDVLKAVDRAAVRLRDKLGESHGMIEKFDIPVEQATTPSLEALKAFSLGAKALNGGDYTASVAALQQAIALDPNFALAYSGLSGNYANLGESSLAIEYAKKAYELRDRATELEKFAIESFYSTMVTGDLEKARQTEELWAQTYPRNADPHFALGNLYNNLGKHEKAVAEARESFRLSSRESLDYGYLSFAYLAVGQLKEARATAEEALAKNLASPSLSMAMYPLDFLQDDTAGMAELVTSAAGQPGVEDVFLEMETDTAAYSGRLEKARGLSLRAVASAVQAKEKETAARYEAQAALREALFGNAQRARQRAAAALKLSAGRDVQYATALALSLAGDALQAQKLADKLEKQFSDDTIVKFNYLPAIRAQVALDRNDASNALAVLQPAAPYELGIEGQGAFTLNLYPVYVRGQAYLAARRGQEALGEFQKILDHRGLVANEPIGALARLQVGRALRLQDEPVKARAAYRDFLALWKGADPDVPILKQAKAEYAKLQ